MVAPVTPLLAWAGLAAGFVIALAAALRMAGPVSLADHPSGVIRLPGPVTATILTLFGLALAGWGLWLVIRHFFSCEDRIAQILALGILIDVAAYLLSTVPTTYWSARELAGVLPAGAAMLNAALVAGLRPGAEATRV